MTERKRRIKKRWLIPAVLLLALVATGYVIYERQRAAEARVEALRGSGVSNFTVFYIRPDLVNNSWAARLFDYLPEKLQHVICDRQITIDITSNEAVEKLAAVCDDGDSVVIKLRGPELTTASLEKVAKLPGLLKLSLIETDFADEDLKLLSHANGLKYATLLNNKKLRGSELKYLNEVNSLERVTVSSSMKPEPTWEILTDQEAFQLTVDNGVVEEPFVLTDERLAQVSRNISRSGVRIRDLQLSDKYLDRLAFLPPMEQIDLSESAISDWGVAEFSKFNDIRRIDLTGNEVTDKAIEILLVEAELTALILDDTNITDRAIDLIVNSDLRNSLEELSMGNTEISAEKARELGKLKKLYSLNLIGTAADDSVLEAIKGCESLQFLWVDQDLVSEEKVRELKNTNFGLRVLYKKRQ